MKYRILSVGLIIASVLVGQAFAGPGNGARQELSIDNDLHNPVVVDPNLTDSPIKVSYFDTTGYECWDWTIPYRDPLGPYTVWAGSGNRCDKYNIAYIMVTPMPGIGSSKPAYDPLRIDIPKPDNFTTDIVIKQQTPPTFDANTGQIATPGTIGFDVSTENK